MRRVNLLHPPHWFYVLFLGGVLLFLVIWAKIAPANSPRGAVTVTRDLTSTLPPTSTTLSPAPSPVPARTSSKVSFVLASTRPLSLSLPTSSPALGAIHISTYEHISYHADDYGIPPLPQIITYTVQPGDTLSTIAARFGLPLDAVRWSNPDIEHNPDDIYPGQVLRIPPINGVVVEVQEGDTIEKLAQRYNVPPEVIRDYAANRLSPPYILKPGTLLVIPGGSKQVNLPPPRPYPGYAYMWPARGVITQKFSARHKGVDIATIYGAYAYAARAGRVRTVRWDDTGYGYMVIIDHGDGWNTLYAHLKGALVQPEQYVRQGDVIGRVGGTGRATGPHVHFEIRKGRVRYDPLKFLPPQP